MAGKPDSIEKTKSSTLIWTTNDLDDPKKNDPEKTSTPFKGVDLGEVECPKGMVVIGIGLAPHPTSGLMSLKLLCADPAILYRPTESKFPDSSKIFTEKEVPDVNKIENAFSAFFCDSRPFCLPTTDTNPPDNQVIGTVSLSVGRGKGKPNRLGFSFRPRRYSGNGETGKLVEFGGYTEDKDNKYYFRKHGDFQVSSGTTPQNPSGVKGLSYDTNMITYYGWTVTGLQLFLRPPMKSGDPYTTIGLNVRFQNFSGNQK